MKMNLWVLADQLEVFEPILRISETEATIEGLRTCSGTEQVGDNNHVYLYREHDGVCLKHEHSSVFLPHIGLEDALNAVLTAFERIQTWEAELNRLSGERSLQELLDHGSALLRNPLTLSSSTGDVLAMSSDYLSEDVDPYWCAARDTGRFPLEVLGAPMYGEDGTLRSWDHTPTLFHTQGGGRLIGSYIRTDDRQVGLGLLQYKQPIRKGDLLLYGRLCEAIASALEKDTEESAGALWRISSGTFWTEARSTLGCSPAWSPVLSASGS